MASSSPEMWRDICLANDTALLAVLDRFEQHLHGVKQAIAGGDGERLMEIFSRAKRARDKFTEAKGR